MQTQLGAIQQIALTVCNIEQARTWYRDTLGLPHLFDAGDLAFFDSHGIRIMLSEPENDFTVQASTVIYFTVENIYQAYTQYRERGINFIDEPHEIARLNNQAIWMVFFTDPDGHTFALSSSVPLEA